MKRVVGTLLLVCAACGSDADVAGNYTLALTSRNNGCSLPNWQVGAQSTATAMVTQRDGDVTMTLQGMPGIELASVIGTSTLSGSVDGEAVLLEAIGTSSRTTGGCVYTYNAEVDATQDGDKMAGRIEYRTATNGSIDCGSREACLSVQDFSGTRSP